MRRALVVIATSALVGALSLTSCTAPDPCLRLAPPSAAELAAAESGADIEREIGGVECDLEGGVWQRDYDSSSSGYKAKTSATKKPATTAKPTTRKPAATTRPRST